MQDGRASLRRRGLPGLLVSFAAWAFGGSATSPRPRDVAARRWWARVGLVAVALPTALSLTFVASTTNGRGQAFAFDGRVPVYVPLTLSAGAQIATAAGATVVVGGTAIAVAPILAAAGATLAGYSALRLLWSWGSGHNPAYADPATPPGTLMTATWSPSGTGSTGQAYYNGTWGTSGTITMTNSRGACSAQLFSGPYVSSCTVSFTGTPTGAYVLSPSGSDLWGQFTFNSTQPAPTAAPASGTTPVTSTPTSTCTNGSVTTVVTGPAITYTGATPSASLPALTAPACPAGYVRTGFSMPSMTPGGLTVPQPLTWTAPTIPSTYANCQPGGSAAPCVLTLTKTNPAGQVTNCTNTDLCAGWNPQGEADGSTYTCRWGPYTLAPTECQTIPTEPTTTPTTTTPTDDPCRAGTATAATQSCVPGTGTTPTVSSPDTTECNGFSWSWNPIDWVYRPARCAILSTARQLFVPTASTSTDLETLRANIATRVPISYLTEVGSYVTGVLGGGGGSGCLVYDVNLASLGSFHILNSCNDAEPIVHVIRLLRPLLGVAELVGFLGPLAWWAWKSYAPLSSANG